MKRALVLIAVLGCSSGPKKTTPTVDDKPKPLEAEPVDRGAQFATAWAEILEAAGDYACACTTDECRETIWTPVMVWMRDAFNRDEGYDVAIEAPTCLANRLTTARRRLDGCSSRSDTERKAAPKNKISCAESVAAEPVRRPPWWEQPNPCPAPTELGLTKLGPPFPTVFRAECSDDGVEDGRYTSFHLNGSLFLDGTYKKGEKHGVWRHFYAHGLLASEQRYVGGALNGPVARVYRNGKLRTTGTYFGNQKFGPWREFDTAGKLETETFFIDDSEVSSDEWAADGKPRMCMLECEDDIPPQVDYSVSAKPNYEKGIAKLAANQWLEGATYLNFVINRFPYSRYKKLAEAELTKHKGSIEPLFDDCVANCNRCNSKCGSAADQCLSRCSSRLKVP